MEYKEEGLELKPKLLEGEFIFCSLEGASYGNYKDLKPIASFQEKEGLTLVISKEKANRNNISYDSSFRCISLGLVSKLEDFGLTSIISNRLTKNKISANIFAGKYHDHIFIPSNKADEALIILNDINNKQEKR